jgi:hypothetical protein
MKSLLCIVRDDESTHISAQQSKNITSAFFSRIDSFLKGLSYKIDFENVDENWQILA